MRSTSAPASPTPGTTRLRFRLAAVLTLIALLGGLAGFGAHLYRIFGPVPLCTRVPVAHDPTVVPFNISNPAQRSGLGSKSSQACPEAERSFMEWYALRVHSDEYDVDLILEAREKTKDWGFASFTIRDSRTLKILMVHSDLGSDVQWAETGLDASMLTRGPSGRRERSFVRYLEEGPHTGEVEIRVLTPDSDLHLFLAPLTLGFAPEHIGSERTRPGSWFKYTCLFIMSSVRGELKLYNHGRPGAIYSFRGDGEHSYQAYMEHMWGNTDRPGLKNISRFYWDYGVWGIPGRKEAFYLVQTDGPTPSVDSVMAAAGDGDPPVLLTHRPPEQFARTVYSHLAPINGSLFPQVLHAWAFAPNSTSQFNMEGFVRATFYDWQATHTLPISTPSMPGPRRTTTRSRR